MTATQAVTSPMMRLAWAILTAFILGGGWFAVAVTPAAAQESNQSVYLVQVGDTLSAIATRYGTSVAALVAANQLSDPDRLEVGQRLFIPRAAAVLASQPTLVLRYVTQPGDTISSIARRWQLDDRVLRQANNWPAGVLRLLPGQEVAIPLGSILDGKVLTDLTIDPIDVAQGQAAVLRLRTSDVITARARYAGASLAMVSAEDGLWGLIGVHPLTTPGTAWLDLDIAGATVPRRLAPALDDGWLRLSVPVNVMPGAYTTQHLVLPVGKGELLQPARLAAERTRLNTIWPQAALAPQWSGVFTRPLAIEFPVTSPFGTRRSYNGGPVSSFHEGQDLGAPEGTPVVAPAAGQVVLAEELAVRGNAVIIDHGVGLHTGYWHLSRIYVQPGQYVQAGDKLGEVGTTGLSTGWHLHWEARIGSTPVDPLPLLERALPD